MLVLTRRKNESIMIGHGIEVVILGIDGDKIRVGIEAPKEITILRKEVYLEVAHTNKEAITSPLFDNLPLSSLFPKKD